MSAILEDVATGGLLALAILNPVAAAIVAGLIVVLTFWLIYKARRFIARIMRKLDPPRDQAKL